MTDLKEILSRIKDILSQEIDNRKVFDKDVAEALGISSVTLATMKNRGRIPYKEILEFCALRKVSINWLIFNQMAKSIADVSEKFERVHYFKDVYASAGGGAMVEDENSEFLTLGEQMIEHLGGSYNIKNIHALNVMGDSMEPTLHNEDIVFIDRTSINPNKNGIYVVTTNAGLFIKRLQLRADGMIALVSDNESYGDELVIANEIEVLGKVVGAMSNSI